MYRLWIVEDDMGIAEAIQTQAELWDMQVRCVRNFRNVMAEFADFDPHIVLLDISLPFFNGYHWCSEIRKVSKVPIIFISSASDNLNMVMAMNLGADDFIAKPFDQSVLMAKLQALLRRTYDFGAPQQVLEQRIMRRDGISRQAAQARLASQLAQEKLDAAATFLLDNTGSEQALRAQARAVLENLLKEGMK